MSKGQPNPKGSQISPRSAAYPKAVDRLIAEFASLPGIGRRTAERLAFYVLKSESSKVLSLARAIEEVKASIRHCDRCWNLSDESVCEICRDPRRDRSIVLVVEQPKDLITLEQTGMYRGLYHVLMGRLSPLDGIGPEELTIPSLLVRLDNPASNPDGAPIREVILGLNPTLEGDGTTLYLAEQLRTRPVSVTRLARGLPSGSQLEFANKAVLADAITGRRQIESHGI